MSDSEMNTSDEDSDVGEDTGVAIPDDAELEITEGEALHHITPPCAHHTDAWGRLEGSRRTGGRAGGSLMPHVARFSSKAR